jgi:hypothetical protein
VLYAISPPVAASLPIICSVVSQLQTLPMIWCAIEWSACCREGVVGFGGECLGGLTRFSGVLPIVWTDIRDYAKEHGWRRSDEQ